MQRERDETVVDKRLTISFGGGVCLFAARSQRDIVIENDGLEIPLGPLPSEVKPLLSVDLEYLLTPIFSFSLQARGGSIYDTEVFPPPLGTSRISIKEDYYSIEVGSSLFMREKTGLRPFFRLATGVLRVRRSHAKMESAYWESFDVHPQLDEVTRVYPLLEAGFGSEYELTPTGPCYFGVYVSASTHFGDATLIRPLVGSAEFRIGINIL